MQNTASGASAERAHTPDAATVTVGLASFEELCHSPLLQIEGADSFSGIAHSFSTLLES